MPYKNVYRTELLLKQDSSLKKKIIIRDHLKLLIARSLKAVLKIQIQVPINFSTI